MVDLLLIAIKYSLVSNVVLSQFLGICAFLGVSKKSSASKGMGAAVIFVTVLASIVSHLIYVGIMSASSPICKALGIKDGLDFLNTIVFILLIAALVQLVEMFMKKYDLSGEETARILMENSSSCYDFKDGKPCGTCKPCTRKWLAILGATGVDTGQYFDTHPRSYFTPETIEQWIDRESGPNNRGRESEEIIATLKTL